MSIYSDADIEQAEWQALGASIGRLRARGVCLHLSAIAYRSPALYPEQVGLLPGQVRCTDGCGTVFASDAAWDEAMRDALDD